MIIPRMIPNTPINAVSTHIAIPAITNAVILFIMNNHTPVQVK